MKNNLSKKVFFIICLFVFASSMSSYIHANTESMLIGNSIGGITYSVTPETILESLEPIEESLLVESSVMELTAGGPPCTVRVTVTKIVNGAEVKMVGTATVDCSQARETAEKIAKVLLATNQ